MCVGYQPLSPVALGVLTRLLRSAPEVSGSPLRSFSLTGIDNPMAHTTRRLGFDVTSLSLTQVTSLWLSGTVYPVELETLLFALRRLESPSSSTVETAKRRQADWA